MVTKPRCVKRKLAQSRFEPGSICLPAECFPTAQTTLRFFGEDGALFTLKSGLEMEYLGVIQAVVFMCLHKKMAALTNSDQALMRLWFLLLG